MIKNYKIFLSALTLVVLSFCSCKSKKLPIHPQNRLVSVLQKDTVKIAFLGGSITNGAGASVYENCWVSGLESHFRKDFDKKISTVNLGIGASSSEFGVYRFEHVLAFKPDLLVVEFAVNDDQLDSALTYYNHEQLYLLAEKHNIAFLSVNLNKSDNISRYDFIEPVLKYHNLPNVRVKMLNEDLIDGVHPSDNGHLKISTAIYNYLNKLTEVENISRLEPKSTPLLNVSANLSLLDTTRWKKSKENFYYLPATGVNKSPNDTSTFSFNGSRCGISVMLRGKKEPQNGSLRIQIDNKKWITINCMNGAPYRIVETHTLASNLENKEHEFKIVTIPEALPDGSFTKNWEIVSILTAE